MPLNDIPDSDFAALFRELGPTEMAKHLDVGVRNIYSRRNKIEKALGIKIETPNIGKSRNRLISVKHRERNELEIKNGIVLIGSDLHLWPSYDERGRPLISKSIISFIKLCTELKPSAVILNGDVLDFPQISRHPPIGWEDLPKVQEEIEFAQEILSEIEGAAGRAKRCWTLGNHDARFETRIATVAPEFAKIHGVHLKDHFPLWMPSYSVWINGDTVCKHRFKGGIHATHNNTIWSGKNIVTGHLHSAKVTPFTDYNGTRYGVDTGCMCDPDGAQFVYTEDNPKNWREAFAVLTFSGGQLMQPELVLPFNDKMQFRGQVL